MSFSYPLQLHPARLSLDSALFGSKGPLFWPKARHIGETTILLAGGFTIAMVVKELDLVLSVIGATGSTLLCYILPGFFYFILSHGRGCSVIRIIALCLCIVGCITMVVCLTFIALTETVFNS